MKIEIAIAFAVVWLGFSIPSVLFADVYDGVPMKGKIYDEIHKCTLINEEPWYNCNRQLRIVIFDTYYVPGYSSIYDDFFLNPESKVLGYTYFKRDITSLSEFDLLILGTESMNGKKGKYYDVYKLTTFQHEIRHIQCHCNFHIDLDRQDRGIGENYKRSNKSSEWLVR